MGLEMKTNCETCERALNDLAYICVHECTFCEECTAKYDSVCPNCSGELVRRPKPPSGIEH
ncbi:DUF1272 domain-containing protein [Rossellomorea aquimaris]|uniref:DUF1272 domain-containing protein n=1 Tax=Rossellomorea aquimaris TaxID=189382 RepID=UPI001CD75370|nr:DUF1272 domain-containing protein [Rossellomorea aquimaris]MCA1058838.1 DUF1272 domain-containing protein [Rossellomorea aquimaris]